MLGHGSRCFRYDLLCFEGLALGLNVFLGKKPVPKYRLVPPSNGELQTIIVHEDVWPRD